MKSQHTLPSLEQISLIEQAISLLHRGKQDEAEKRLRQLLRLFPFHPQILSSLGMIAMHHQNYQEAVLLFANALTANPMQIDILHHQGMALAFLKRFDEAVTCFNRVISQQPNAAEAYNNRGNVYLEMGLIEDAVTSYNRAVEINPGYAEAYYNLGNALLKCNRHLEALTYFNITLSLRPDLPEAYNNQGNALLHINQFDEALQSFEKALSLRQDFNEAKTGQQTALQAIDKLQTLLLDTAAPAVFTDNDADAMIHHGNFLKRLNQPEKALHCFRQLIKFNPEHAAGFYNLGLALQEAGQFEQALQAYNRCLTLKPNLTDAYNNRGNTLQFLLRYEEAVSDYNKALALDPLSIMPYNNRGYALQILRRFDEAVADYDQAIRLKPDYADPYWNKALLKIVTGAFAEGWKLYEWRWQALQNNQLRSFNQPLWLGDPAVAGKTILIYPEQGLGDFIQFVRYVPLLAALGARVILETPLPLMALIATLKGDFKRIAYGDNPPDFDMHCPIASLPYAFKTTLATIPAAIPYLYAKTDPPKTTGKRTKKKSTIKIGLAWSGSATHKNDYLRSIKLSELQAVLALPFEFHALQIEIRPDDAKLLSKFKNLQVHTEEIKDFADTATLIDTMDLIISVDTSVAHLAGAMGKPVWILLAHTPDYRWLLDRTDSPWYPTATLIRQATAGDWSEIIPVLVKKLKSLTLDTIL